MFSYANVTTSFLEAVLSEYGSEYEKQKNHSFLKINELTKKNILDKLKFCKNLKVDEMIIYMDSVMQFAYIDKNTTNSMLLEKLTKGGFLNDKKFLGALYFSNHIFALHYWKSTGNTLNLKNKPVNNNQFTISASEEKKSNEHCEVIFENMNPSNNINLYVDLNICSFLQQISDLFEKQQPQGNRSSKIKSCLRDKEISVINSVIHDIHRNNNKTVEVINIKCGEKYELGDIIIYGLNAQDCEKQRLYLKDIANFNLLNKEHLNSLFKNRGLFCNNIKTFVTEEKKLNFQIWLSYKEFSERQLGSFFFKGIPIKTDILYRLLTLYGILIPGPFDQSQLSKVTSVLSEVCGKKNEPLQPNYKYNEYGDITGTLDLTAIDWNKYFDWLVGGAQLFKIDTNGMQITPFQIKFPCILSDLMCIYIKPGLNISFGGKDMFKLEAPLNFTKTFVTPILNGRVSFFADFSLFINKRSITSLMGGSLYDLLNPSLKSGFNWNSLGDKDGSVQINMEISEDTEKPNKQWKLSLNNDNSYNLYEGAGEILKITNNNSLYYDRITVYDGRKLEVSLNYLYNTLSNYFITNIIVGSSTSKDNSLKESTYYFFKDSISKISNAIYFTSSVHKVIWNSLALLGTAIITLNIGACFIARFCHGIMIKDDINTSYFFHSGVGVFICLEMLGYIRFSIIIFINNNRDIDICFGIIHNHNPNYQWSLQKNNSIIQN